MTLEYRRPLLKKRLDPGWTKEMVALYNQTSGEMRKTMLAAFEQMKKDMDMQALAKAIEAGDGPAALKAIPLSVGEQAANEIEMDLQRAMIAAGNLEVGTIGVATRAGIVFNPRASKVLAWLKEHTATNIVGITDESRTAIKGIIREAIETGRHPYRTTKAIKQQVGLLPRHAKAVENYRLKLEAKGTAEEKIEKMTARYADSLLTARAENIARTEAMQAIGEGRDAMRRQLVEEGVLKPDFKQQWLTAEDERVCPICGANHMAIRKVGEAFPSGDTTAPSHVNCRCITVLYGDAMVGEEEE